MRRPRFRQTLFPGAAGAGVTGTFAHRLEFATQHFQFIRELQHCLVLLRDVPLQVGNLLLEGQKAIIHRRAEAWALRRSA